MSRPSEVTEYVAGSAVTLTAVFSDQPTAVAFTVVKPNGTTSTPSVTGPTTTGTGEHQYTATFDTTGQSSGLYHYYVVGTGAAKAAEWWKFRVRQLPGS